MARFQEWLECPLRVPGCVKTCTSRECAELFSLFSSFDGDCQSGSFLIQCNRDKLSTRKFDVGVFTPPGSKADVGIARMVRGACSGGFPTRLTTCGFHSGAPLRVARPMDARSWLQLNSIFLNS